MVEVVLDLARTDMESRHGKLPGPGLAVIAYGGLGAEALGFDSDLDLIFLYQPTPILSDGKRPISAERFHTGVARRLLSLLSASTPAGRLYSIDARLRPNGRAGLLVSSLDAFSRYQSEEAWVWELQALTRARPVAGNVKIARRFNEIRYSVLTASRDEHLVREEVPAMRKRILDEHGSADPLKHAPGGLLDIEFVAQFGLLLNASRYLELTTTTRIDKQLGLLQDCGWLDKDEMLALLNAFDLLLDNRLRSALLDQKPAQHQPSPLNIARALCDGILR
jgi:glutamate-ammonia-ligase adenylyltransferase